jgi:exopolysaccharide biosynthesis polyprenyl glycosylphosphotransferase
MTNKDIRTVWHALQVPLDLIGVVCAMLTAFFVRKNYDHVFGIDLPQGYIPTQEEYLNQVIIMGMVLLLVFTFQGLYSTKFRRQFIKEIPFIAWSVLLWAMFIFSWFFLTRSFFFSRFVLIVGAASTFLFIVLFRILLRVIGRLFLRKGIGKVKILIIGKNTVSNHIHNLLTAQNYCSIIGTYTMNKEELSLKDSSIITISLEDALVEYGIEEVIYTENIANMREIEEVVYLCRVHHASFRFVPEVVQIHSKNINSEYIGDIPVIELKETKLDGWGKIFKRIFDIAGSGILLLILIIPFIVIGIIIKIDSQGPVFVKLDRINRGNVFKLYKFRSMVNNAHDMKKTLLKYNEREGGPLFKMKNDPRITKTGKILRKTRIDELPQLFNVFLGTMSLVGPRPHEPGEVAHYERHHKKVLTVKPGMTGLAQVQGASDLSFEDEVKSDTFYIENWSLWFDIEILFKTIWVVLSGKGAA